MAYAATPDRDGGVLLRGSKAPVRDARREQEFRRARRHSVLVIGLKFILPLTAAGMLSLYILPSFLKKSIDHGRGTATVRRVEVQSGSLVMIEPHVKGVNEKGEAYDFVAAKGTQAAKNAETMYLEIVRGKMTALDGKVTTLTAPDAIQNNKADQITFNNGAYVTRDGGMSATFKKATAYMKEQRLKSKTPVTVRLHESTINADAMTLHWGGQNAVFEGNVRTHIERQPAEAPPGEPAGHAASKTAAQTPVSGLSGLGGDNSKKPIDIESDRLEVDDKTHIAIFIGNVSATQGDYNLKAPRLEVYYEGGSQNQPGAKTAQAPKPATPVIAPAPGESGEASTLTKCINRSIPPVQALNTQASKPVKPVKAASASDSSDPLSSGQIKCLHATGGKVVAVSTKDQQQADGEDAVYDVFDQKLFMTGKKVALTQKGHVMDDGNELVVNLATGQANVYNHGAAADNKPIQVHTHLKPEQGKDSKPANAPGTEGKKKDRTAPPKGSTPKPAAPASGWQTQSQ